MKKEEVPQVTYNLTRGMTETIHCKYITPCSQQTANRKRQISLKSNLKVRSTTFGKQGNQFIL